MEKVVVGGGATLWQSAGFPRGKKIHGRKLDVFWNLEQKKKSRMLEEVLVGPMMEVSYIPIHRWQVEGTTTLPLYSTYPTDNSPLINFLRSSDAEIFLLSADWARKSAPDVQKRARNVYVFRPSFHSALHRCWSGSTGRSLTRTSRNAPFPIPPFFSFFFF